MSYTIIRKKQGTSHAFESVAGPDSCLPLFSLCGVRIWSERDWEETPDAEPGCGSCRRVMAAIEAKAQR